MDDDVTWPADIHSMVAALIDERDRRQTAGAHEGEPDHPCWRLIMAECLRYARILKYREHPPGTTVDEPEDFASAAYLALCRPGKLEQFTAHYTAIPPGDDLVERFILWLHMIVAGWWKDRLRYATRRPATSLDASASARDLYSDTDFRRIEMAERLQRIQAYLLTRYPAHVRYLLAQVLNGYAPAKIALLFGVTPKSVSEALSRLRKGLKAVLAEWDADSNLEFTQVPQPSTLKRQSHKAQRRLPSGRKRVSPPETDGTPSHLGEEDHVTPQHDGEASHE